MKGWFLPRDKVNDIVAETINRSVKRAKATHMVDIKFNTSEYSIWEQADWIKYLEVVNDDE